MPDDTLELWNNNYLRNIFPTGSWLLNSLFVNRWYYKAFYVVLNIVKPHQMNQCNWWMNEALDAKRTLKSLFMWRGRKIFECCLKYSNLNRPYKSSVTKRIFYCSEMAAKRQSYWLWLIYRPVKMIIMITYCLKLNTILHQLILQRWKQDATALLLQNKIQQKKTLGRYLLCAKCLGCYWDFLFILLIIVIFHFHYTYKKY